MKQRSTLISERLLVKTVTVTTTVKMVSLCVMAVGPKGWEVQLVEDCARVLVPYPATLDTTITTRNGGQ